MNLFLLVGIQGLSSLISSDALFQRKRTRKVHYLPALLHKHWATADVILFGTSFKVISSLVINDPAIAFLNCRIRQNYYFYMSAFMRQLLPGLLFGFLPLSERE